MAWWNYVPIVNGAVDAAQGNWKDALLDATVDPFHAGRTTLGLAKDKLYDQPVEQQQAGYQSALDLLRSQAPGIAKGYQAAAQRAQAFYAPAADFYNQVYGPGNGRYGRGAPSQPMPNPGVPAGSQSASILGQLAPTAPQAPSGNNTQATNLPHGTPLGVYINGNYTPYK